MESWENLSVLVTGGTGSFGKKFIENILRTNPPRRLIVFSRDELKQFEMQQTLSPAKYPCLRYFLGDVRDKERLYRAFADVDIVVHAAALKQVPACEYNPLEAIKTNILGAANIIDAAIDSGVSRVLALSTDKAANPINLYGATKLCSDKLFTSANHYSGKAQTRFSVVRYGNVVASRGSVIPFFVQLRKTGELPITDRRMTRFFITLDQGVQFVADCLGRMEGGEIFVPKIPSVRIVDLAAAIAPEAVLKDVGIRPGEKIHEVMVPEDDAHNTLEYDTYFRISSSFQHSRRPFEAGRPCPAGFSYSSDKNDRWLSGEELAELVRPHLNG